MKKDNWIYKVFLMTFFLSLAFSFISNAITTNANLIVMIVITILVIVIGIIFDMIGTAALTSNEATFHAKSSRKIKGAKESLSLIKNSVKVASICNDVIGDICGILSGSMGAMVAISLSKLLGGNITLSSIIVSSIISSLTVGGKAIFKKVAIKKCDSIVFIVGKINSVVKLNKN
ncbi:MAG: hypothetical protein IJD92_01655 [Bacilli bacterium]|nr:hypothetical protein [Bacilli bacterium]